MELPQYETLKLSVDGAVATVHLNRPDKANSMNAPMWRELQESFEWLDAESAIRAVVLCGEGRLFCGGLDLAMFGDIISSATDPARRAEDFRRKVLSMQDNLSALEKCRKPVLAAIHGPCIGGGVDLVCAADMRYATEDAFFCIREIDIGMTADVGTLQRMPKLIPDGVVRELAYTGRNMEAAEALQLGFVNRVYADREALLAGVQAIAAEIAAKAPLAIRGTKEMLVYSRDHSVTDSLNYIATWNAGMLSQVDLMEGVTAQAEKRAANYDD